MATDLVSAIEDFRRARRQATIQQIIGRLTGKSADLLSYDDVRRKLGARESAGRRLEEIPLDAIVGSVGRYSDFTRSFLPRRDSDEERWARVNVAMAGPGGLPPVEVYRIGQAYFVKDGNHRVSIARRLGATHIEAYVTDVHARIDLSPDVQPDDLILKAEYTDFLERVRLDQIRPGADLSVTVPGQYQTLEEHIQVHRYFMGLERKREIPYEEAVAHWYDEVYLPVVQIIRGQGVLRDFPGRTEADLYLWVAEHRAALEEELGWEVRPEAVAADLATQFSLTPKRIVARIVERIRGAVVPDELGAGPPPGQWRREHLAARRDDRLFADVLVAITGDEAGWRALDQALVVARREEGRVQGLYVASSKARAEGKKARAMQAEFEQRCQASGVTGRLTLEVGRMPEPICERAPWTDLLVLGLNHPSARRPAARLSSGMRNVIRRCPGPVLVVPGVPSPLDRALLAYDGSPKAEEALFVAAYLAGRWGIPLVVVTIAEGGRITTEVLARARSYLEAHGVPAIFLDERGPVSGAVMITAEEQGCDLIIMGGYGFNPVVGMVLGSAVDEVLRTSRRSVLICR